MNTTMAGDVSHQEPVSFPSLGDEIQATLFTPASAGPHPVLIITHGAGEFKENYYELSEHLVKHGIAALALDMHGHGKSGGRAYQIEMKEWVADIRAACDFITRHEALDAGRIGAFGLSSGGTAILEAAVIEPRLKALVTLDATIMDTLPFGISVFMRTLAFLGRIKRMVTGHDLKISLVSMLNGLELASDPEINKRLQKDPGKLQAFTKFPLPGAAQAFIVNTIKRVPQIRIPTLVIWGEDDKLDPITTAQRLHKELTCVKELVVVPGNGHVGHLDRNREKVFELTSAWLLNHLPTS
jgi:alpha-beta hydrolase superfamily lysophospholipase